MILRIAAFTVSIQIIFSGILYPQIHRDAWEVLKGNTNSPSKREFRDEYLKRLRLPEGFKISVYAKDLKGPRMMAQSGQGIVYVTSPSKNLVYALHDPKKNGKAVKTVTVLKGLKEVHGITIKDGRLYLCTPEKLLVCDILKNGNLSEPRTLINDLPEAGRHGNRTIGFGPDGNLYISVGSSCNACAEKNREHAAILKSDTEGKQRTIFASGLRNTIGFDWHPVTRQMWGMDHGSDWRGNDTPPEELNRLEEGKNYGWPYCYGKSLSDKEMDNPENNTKDDFCRSAVPSVLDYQAHAAPIEMLFYNSEMFPEEYRGDAFVAFHGSWNRNVPVGYNVARIRFSEKGEPEKFEDFISGFLIEKEKAQFGRPAGLCVLQDGSMLVSDDSGGIIYRITYSK